MENKIKEMDDQYLAHCYARFPLCIEKGKGSFVYDSEGKEYLDFTSGIGVNSLGYAYQPWVEAVQEQVSKLTHISNLFYTKPMVTLGEKLVKRTNMSRVFFQNSGAEANEGAIKVAHKYANDTYQGQRNEILTLVNSFHGRTMETLMANGQEVFHQKFGPFPPGFNYVEANNIEDLQEKVNEHTSAIMMEMVQGEGGVNALDPIFVQKVQEICDEKDILLIVDEVQTGVGRTGTFFAYEQFGIHPDIVSFAKGIANGIPMGGVLLSEKVKDVIQYGDHGSTFAGNPLACTSAHVVLDTITSEFLDEVKEKGQLIKERLEKMPHVKSVSGLGMMIGVELEEAEAKEVLAQCRDKGVLFLTAKTKIRMLPPLIMTKDEIQKGMDVLESVLKEI